jgi:hypothetical protein
MVNTIGESTQWVCLDDFGELEQVPLDRYRDRVESCDLRDDGYAERLRSFFVFQGTRRLFIPLKGAGGGLEGRVAAALRDIPFSLAILTPPAFTDPKSVVLPGMLFIAAAVCTLFLSGEVLLCACFLPLWAVLAGLGVPGFALMALMAGLSRLLREPVREYFTMRRCGKDPGDQAPRQDRVFTVLGVPLGGLIRAWILPVLFLAGLGCITILGALPVFTCFLGILFFLILLCLSLWAESHRGAHRGHIHFRPVPITDSALRPFSYSRIMVPFTLTALVLLILSTVFPAGTSAPSAPAAASRGGREWTGWKSPLTPDAEAYREHVEFQQAFSFMPLHSGDGAETAAPPAYLRYGLAADGLIGGAVLGAEVSVESADIPPFPLVDLIDFITNYTYTAMGIGAPYSGALLCLVIVLGLGIPLIFRDRRGQRKLAMYMDKRIAA